MRSLFTKILLWFLLTVVISLTGSFYIWNTFGQRPNQQPQFSSRPFELHEARHAWETDGRAGLERLLAQFKESTTGDAVLTDGSGRDVLTGHDWWGEIQQSRAGGGRGRGGPMFPFVRIESGHRSV